MPPEMGRLRNTVNGLDTYQIPKQVLECFLRKKRFFCTKTLLSDILAEPRTMLQWVPYITLSGMQQ